MNKRIVLAFLALAACDRTNAGSGPVEMLEPKPSGIEAEPRWLTFTCVEPGCNETLEAQISVIGRRDVAIKRIVLSERDRNDFLVTSSEEPPFVLTAGEALDVSVQYLPTGDVRLGDVELEVIYTDASASEEEDRIEPGELKVPLVRRLIGEPRLAVDPGQLVFGAVLPTAEKRLPLTISNDGFGNVGLIIDSIEAEPAGVVRVERLPERALVPGDSWDLEVVFAPNNERFLEGWLNIEPVGSTVEGARVPLLGTSIENPTVYTEPADRVDFGEVPVGFPDMATVTIQNRGAADLFVSDVRLAGQVAGADMMVMLEDGVTTATIPPLGTLDAIIAVEGTAPGEIDTSLRITSTDRETPVLDVPVTGLITKPIIQVTPGTVDFGAVPRGWTTVQTVEIENVGYGDLVLSNVAMILGSSELFTMRTVPTLPITLRHDQRIAVEIEFRSEAEASFSGTLAIDSNDAENQFMEIQLAAQGASCDARCPIANGTPTCTRGLCEVASCDPNWYDSDVDPVNGCECREVSNNGDPSAFCSEGRYLGTVDDDGDRTSFTGLIHAEDDIDMIRFFGEDKTNFFSDDFDVRVTLDSADPNIKFCVYRHDTGNHLTECFLENESCPGNRSYRRDGDLGPDDSADFVVKIFREPGTAASCTPYTVFIRNG
ncbi:MAG: choice-of-anchor D domain-containing protein [Deltaproteobacteria bacterium]